MVAPCVIGPAARGWLKRAAEIGQRERGHLVATPSCGRVVERIERGRQLSKEVCSVASWLLCVSKPPRDTKKICRFAPVAARASIILATVSSCLAMTDVRPAKALASSGLVLVRIGFTSRRERCACW